jgi:TRAP-type C4-dicarboxylate transport system permease small subunit
LRASLAAAGRLAASPPGRGERTDPLQGRAGAKPRQADGFSSCIAVRKTDVARSNTGEVSEERRMIERMLTGFSRACTAAGSIALLAMMLVTNWDIVGRAVFSDPLHGAVDMVEVCVLLVAFLGLPEVFLRDEQIRVDIVDSIASPSLLRLLKLIGLLLAVLFLALLAFNVFSPMVDAYRFGDIKPDIRLPVYLLYAVVFMTFAASVATAALLIVRFFAAHEAA